MANLEHSQEAEAVVVPTIIVTTTQTTKTVLDHKEVLVAVATVVATAGWLLKSDEMMSFMPGLPLIGTGLTVGGTMFPRCKNCVKRVS